MVSQNPLEMFQPKKLTLDKLKSKKFIYNEEYQRSEIWKTPQKQKLVDSILLRYPIGLLIFRELEKDKKFEVIDGQQRLKTLSEFVRKDCKWKTSKDSLTAPSMSIKEIKKDKDLKRRFEGYGIWFICLPSDDEQTCDIFVRMQEGVRANTAEKLNAMRGKMRNLIFELSSKLKFFEKTSISNHRFGYRDVLSNICLLEMSFLDNRKTGFPEFPDLRFGKLKKMYKDYKDVVPPYLEKNIKRTFNFLDSCFGKKVKLKDAKFIENKGDFLQVYLLASIISKDYVVSKETKEKFASFFRDFLVKVMNEKLPEHESQKELKKDPHKFYSFLRSKGQTKENLKRKFQLLTNKLFKNLKNLESKVILKDKNRIFEFCQRVYVFYKKDYQTCQKCKKKVEWGVASFHHKRFHSRGGPTTINNCQLLHKRCHLLLHKEKGPDKD